MALLSLLAISCADKTPGAEGKPGTDGDIKTVQIDKQVWMAENMAVTTDAEGKVRQDFFGRSEAPFRAVTNKVIVPDDEEQERNPRSRSAKLRVAEKTECKL